MSDKISRCDFLKLTLTSLTACGRALGIPATLSSAAVI
jgi:hypothetical protein